MLGRHRRATDDEHVDPGIDDRPPELLGPLRRQGTGDGDAGVSALAQPLDDQLGLDLLAIDLRIRAVARSGANAAISSSRGCGSG